MMFDWTAIDSHRSAIATREGKILPRLGRGGLARGGWLRPVAAILSVLMVGGSLAKDAWAQSGSSGSSGSGIGNTEAPALEPAPRDTIATRQAVQRILVDHWGSSPDEVTRRGNAIQREALGNNVDPRAVQFSYALLLMKTGNYKSAVYSLRKVLKTKPGTGTDEQAAKDLDALAHLGMAVAQMNDDKADASAAALQDAIDLAPNLPATVDMTAVFVTYLSEKPLRKMRRSRLGELEHSLLVNLEPEMLERYRQCAEQTREYIQRLPEVRDRMMGQAKPIQAQITQIDGQIAPLQAQIEPMKQQIGLLQQQAQGIQIQGLNTRAYYDQLILKAQQEGDGAAVLRLTTAKAAALNALQVQLNQINQQIIAIQGQIAGIEQQIVGFEQQKNKLLLQIKEIMTKVEAELSIPPLPFDLDALKQYMLTGVRAPSMPGPLAPAAARQPANNFPSGYSPPATSAPSASPTASPVGETEGRGTTMPVMPGASNSGAGTSPLAPGSTSPYSPSTGMPGSSGSTGSTAGRGLPPSGPPRAITGGETTGGGSASSPSSSGTSDGPASSEENKAKTLLVLGETFQRAGQANKAIQLYQQILTQYPNTASAQQARSHLQAIGM